MTDNQDNINIRNLAKYDDDEVSVEDNDINIEDKVDDHTHISDIHNASFKQINLKPELLRALDDNGFEHPSEVQHQCIPAALLGNDILCQAKSGMGKTAVFVLSILHLLDAEETPPRLRCIVLCHARELAIQIQQEFNRFKKHFVNKRDGSQLIKTKILLGGTNINQDRQTLRSETPNIVIGTPGRTLQLSSEGILNLDYIKYFVVDECDKVLGPESTDMRYDVQKIFTKTPHNKQVMMFSATLSDEIRGICKRFMNNPREIIIDEGKKLRLHGLQQYYVKLKEEEKNKKLIDIFDKLDFNQVFVFVNAFNRAHHLDKVLRDEGFPSLCLHGKMNQDNRTENFKKFKEGTEARILVTTNLCGRGMDFKSVNVVINYDMPGDEDTYLHRVGRAGRFGTKGLAISFITTEADEKLLEDVRNKFVVPLPELPDEIDKTSYMSSVENNSNN